MKSYNEYFKGNEKGAAIIYRYLGVLCALKLKNTEVTPNQLTVISFLFGILSAVLFVVDSYWSTIYAIILYQICIVLDYADGTLARLKQQNSFLGIWLEAVLDPLREFFVIFGVCIGLWNQYLDPMIWILGFILIATNYMMDIEAITFESYPFATASTTGFTSKSGLYSIGKHFISIRTTRYMAIVLFGIAGQMFAFLAFFAAYNICVFLSLAFVMGKVFRKQDKAESPIC